MIADELRRIDIPEKNIIFLNLDQRNYRKIKTADQLEELIAEKLTEHGTNYIFIDEIQNVKNFEDVINGFREDGNCSIFITGSNSYLLSGELATKLTGRYIQFEIYTLTFDEYEQMKAFYGIKTSPNLLIELQNYILEGGSHALLQSLTLLTRNNTPKALWRKYLRRIFVSG